MVLLKGKPVNNDTVGKTLLAVMNEIYVEAKIFNDNITKKDVQAIIGLWELFMQDSEEDVDVTYKGMDVSGLMEDIE